MKLKLLALPKEIEVLSKHYKITKGFINNNYYIELDGLVDYILSNIQNITNKSVIIDLNDKTITIDYEIKRT